MNKSLSLAVVILILSSCTNQSKSIDNKTTSAMLEKSVTLAEPPMLSDSEFLGDSVSPQTISRVSRTGNQTIFTQPPMNINERKIIRTAQMRFKVAKTDNAASKVEVIAKKMGGYVTQSQMSSNIIAEKEIPVSGDSSLHICQYQLENTMTVRVPNHHLDSFLTEMSRIYTFLDSRQVSADDVTLTYWSNQIKAYNKKNAARRIQNATDVKGKNLGDIVNAETAQNQLQDEAIDQQIAQAEKDFNIQYSVVNLSIYQDTDIIKTVKANPNLYAYSPGFFTRLLESLSRGWANVLDVFLVFVSVWYVFVIVGLAYYIIYRKGINLTFFSKNMKVSIKK